METARRKIAEVEAALVVAQGRYRRRRKASCARPKALTSRPWTSWRPSRSCTGAIPASSPLREIEKLEVRVEATEGAVAAATAAKQAAEMRVSTVLPAEKASAEAALAQAQVELDKTVIRAGVSGRVEQFFLRVGDIVNPLMRPAGVLIPEGAGQRGLQAGFGQIEAQIMKAGMMAEVTCVSKPCTIIPMVVTDVQDCHRGRPVPRRRATDRCAAGDAARHASGVSRAALRGRAGWRDAGQQLHRQRLFQQPRHDRCQKDTGTMRRVALHAVDASGWCTP